jgi:heat shock protein HtpX
MKTAMLLAALTALVLWVGTALGGQVGLVLALVVAAAMNLGAYWYSDRLVLRMYGACEVGDSAAPRLYRIVRDLAARAALPMPKVYVIPEDAPNAFATGRNAKHAAVAVTEGLMRVLDERELRGVIAHELGHIKNRDTLIMTVSGAIAGALSMLANAATFGMAFGSSNDEEGGSPLGGLLGILIAPVAASLIQLAISRSREFIADETAASLTGDPLALARALRKIEVWSQSTPMHGGTPATAHLFIVNPFTSGGLSSLFSTHPPTSVRIARLEQMVIGGTAGTLR